MWFNDYRSLWVSWNEYNLSNLFPKPCKTSINPKNNMFLNEYRVNKGHEHVEVRPHPTPKTCKQTGTFPTDVKFNKSDKSISNTYRLRLLLTDGVIPQEIWCSIESYVTAKGQDAGKYPWILEVVCGHPWMVPSCFWGLIKIWSNLGTKQKSEPSHMVNPISLYRNSKFRV